MHFLEIKTSINKMPFLTVSLTLTAYNLIVAKLQKWNNDN